MPKSPVTMGRNTHALDGAVGAPADTSVQWDAIYKTLQRRARNGKPVRYLVLEGTWELLESPHTCPGCEFAVVLSSLEDLG